MRAVVLVSVVAVATVATSAGNSLLASPVAAPPRFFFAGDGHLRLRHAHFDSTLDVRYRRADGSYDPQALAQIRHFFRSREDGREAPIALRLIELLAYVQDHFHPRQMTLLSGYRSPEFNADLRASGGAAAQTSLHTQAMAADVAFTGIDLRQLWKQLRTLQTGGVGYYRSGKFLHIDAGPPRFWEETTSRVGENLSAGNARVFARTDFDRYPQLDGALATLHSVTAFPLLIAPEAQVVDAHGVTHVTIAPINGAAQNTDGCLAITTPAEAYEFRVISTAQALPAVATTRARVVFRTCEPRIEKTPAEIESNPIEIAAP